MQYFDDPDGGVVRLSFTQNFETWAPGQHFFLTFPALTIWQSHPFTILSTSTSDAASAHTYIARCRKGETGRLKNLILATENQEKTTITPVILCGPYGTDLVPTQGEVTNILAISGGTGVSLTLPVVMVATNSPAHARAAIDFIWMIRRASNMEWVASEMEELKRRAKLSNINLRIHIYITQERSTSISTQAQGGKTSLDIGVNSVAGSQSSVASIREENFHMTFMDDHHPSLRDVVANFMETRADSAYRTKVIASGPRGMGGDLRAAVAASNDGAKVWRNEKRFDVSLEWDDRG